MVIFDEAAERIAAGAAPVPKHPLSPPASWSHRRVGASMLLGSPSSLAKVGDDPVSTQDSPAETVAGNPLEMLQELDTVPLAPWIQDAVDRMKKPPGDSKAAPEEFDLDLTAKRWNCEWAAISASGAALENQAAAIEKLFTDTFSKLKDFEAGFKFKGSDAEKRDEDKGDEDKGTPCGDDEKRKDADDDLQAWEEASAANGKFNLRGKVGGIWARQLENDPELKKAYDEVGKKYKDQRSFRDKWVKQELANKTESKSKNEVDEAFDGVDGEYTCATMIWRAQGGDAAGLEATKTYIDNCIQFTKQGKTCKGRQWILWNEMTGRFDFLLVKKTFQERKGISYGLKTEYHDAPVDQVIKTPGLPTGSQGSQRAPRAPNPYTTPKQKHQGSQRAPRAPSNGNVKPTGAQQRQFSIVA